MLKTKTVLSLAFALLAPVSLLRAQDSLAARWRAIAADAHGHVGVGALIIESGQAASMNKSAHYPMQSVYKLPISMAVLQKVDQGQLALDQSIEIKPDVYVPRGKRSPLRDDYPRGTHKSIRELMAYALVESDGSASDVLLKLAGGPLAVTNYLRSLGITEIVVADSEMNINWKTQYRNWCTPEAAVQLLANLQNGKGLSSASRSVIFDDLQKSQTGANRIRRLLPPGTIVADKTGTSGTERAVTAATNDIGLITLPDGRHLALAVFVSDSSASDAVRENVIAKIARAAWDAWVSEK
ncbi:MAG: class A beta-lactamase [Candidatus Acidiferrum sp.]